MKNFGNKFNWYLWILGTVLLIVLFFLFGIQLRALFLDSYLQSIVTFDTTRLGDHILKFMARRPDFVVLDNILKLKKAPLSIDFILCFSDNVNMYYIYVKEGSPFAPYDLYYYLEPLPNGEFFNTTGRRCLGKPPVWNIHDYMVDFFLNPRKYEFNYYFTHGVRDLDMFEIRVTADVVWEVYYEIVNPNDKIIKLNFYIDEIWRPEYNRFMGPQTIRTRY